MRKYELLFVLKPTLGEETVAKISFLKEVMEKNGAKIVAFDDMGVRKLAYEVQKFERGHYGVFYFEAPADALLEIERNIRITEDFIKFMFVKYEKQKELAFFNSTVEKLLGGGKKEAKETKEESEDN